MQSDPKERRNHARLSWANAHAVRDAHDREVLDIMQAAHYAADKLWRAHHAKH